MATTYTVTFDLAEAQTGVSGHYPVLVRNSTYCPDNTIYAKTGDTVKFVVSEPSPDGASVSYNNTNVADTDPDPDEFTDDGTTNQNSPSSWEYTLTSAAEDSEFYWFWFGTTVHSSGSGKKYSQRIRVNRVVGSPLMNGSTSAITVDQGDTITFSVSGLGGLLAASGNNDNRLYFAIFNQASGGSLINPTSYTGGGWDSSSNQLGKVKTTDTSTVLTVGSNMPTGTYYVYLTHFNAADSPGGNDFYGSEHRLSTTALQFTVQAPANNTNTTPSLGSDISAGSTLSYAVETNSGTITCDPTSFTPTVAVSDITGFADTKSRLKNADGTYPTTTYTDADKTLTSGQSVDFKMTGPAGYSDTTKGRLTIGSVYDELTVTTGPEPDDDDDDALVDTTSNYGLKIFKDDNTTQIFGTGMKQGHVLVSASYSGTVASAASSNPITIPGIVADDNIPGRTAILIIDKQANTGVVSWIVYRTANATTFTVYNGNPEARTFDYIVLRH